MCAHRKCSVRAMAAGVSLSSVTGMKTSLVAFIPTPKVPGEIKKIKRSRGRRWSWTFKLGPDKIMTE